MKKNKNNQVNTEIKVRQKESIKQSYLNLGVNVKNGVELPELNPHLQAIVDAFRTELDMTIVVNNSLPSIIAVITSGKEKVKGRLDNSKHYIDAALDFRISNIPDRVRVDVCWNISKNLGINYDVVMKKDHIHIEYDKKQESKKKVKSFEGIKEEKQAYIGMFLKYYVNNKADKYVDATEVAKDACLFADHIIHSLNSGKDSL